MMKASTAFAYHNRSDGKTRAPVLPRLLAFNMSSQIMFRNFLLAPGPHHVLLCVTQFHKSQDVRVGSSKRDKEKCKVMVCSQAGRVCTRLKWRVVTYSTTISREHEALYKSASRTRQPLHSSFLHTPNVCCAKTDCKVSLFNHMKSL